MQPTFLRAYPPTVAAEGETRWLVFRGSELVVALDADQVTLMADRGLLGELLSEEPMFLGTIEGINYVAFELPKDAALPEGLQPIGLRALFGRLGEAEYSVAGYASQMLYWQRTSRFCPVCGSPTEPVSGDWGRRCTNCGFARYPQISPAILALVHDGDRILLTHKPGWSTMFSIIAGFVEPNEALEECVHREVQEESGLEVDEVVYFGSQGWPYPAQLMVGFLCRYASGEIQIDDKELDDARWFDVHDLPALPGKLSLSRQLIDHWIASRINGA